RSAAGLVRAALELCEQLGSHGMPERIYVPWGTGATAVGLAVGLALAGCTTAVHAVVVVEHALSTAWWKRRLIRWVRAELAAHGVDTPAPVPIILDRSQLGL